MQLALELGTKGIGLTSPNPPVGAVIVANGQEIGKGWHHRAGLPHAEREAIRDAIERGHEDLLAGATLYVTLEPCCTQGRTPACTDAIIERKIGRVVFGATDPNPKHAGAAVALLEAHGIEAVSGVLEAECCRLIRSFAQTMIHGRPWVIVKTAMSLDGRITRQPGRSQWLTSELARNRVHTLRARVDGILTGGETVRRDCPALTIRTPDAPVSPDKMQPWRFVATQHPETLPMSAPLFTDEYSDRTVIVPSVTDWKALMKRFYQDYGVSTLLVEAGGHLIRELLNEHLVDEWVGFYAPMILGGSTLSVAGDDFLTDEIHLKIQECQRIGQDFLISGLVDYD